MDFEMSLRPDVWTFVLVTLMAIVGITVLKFLVTRYPVPGLSEIVLAV
jgi:hypothetical protein